MLNFSERLRKAIENEGLNPSAAEKIAKVPNGTFARAVNGSAIQQPNLEKFCIAFPNISPKWLLTGMGHMLSKTGLKREEIDQGIMIEVIDYVDYNLETFMQNNKFNRIIKEIKSASFEDSVRKDIMKLQAQIKAISKGQGSEVD